MKQQFKLKGDSQSFFKEYDNFLNSFKDIFEGEVPRIEYDSKEEYTSSEIENIEKEITLWEKELLDFIKEHIQPTPLILIDDFAINTFIDNKESLLLPISDQFKNDSAKKYVRFKKIKEYLLITDSLFNNSLRSLYSVQEKINFILSKLAKINSEASFSVKKIFDLNLIEYREDEPKEIAENLDERGYAKKVGYDKDYLKITVKGAAYIERKNKQPLSKKAKDLNQKIDFVIAELVKLGYGQEVIFNEIEELRSLSKKLSKKSWGQLLKGKVIDMSLNSIINKKTATFIYETLSEKKLELLS